MGKGELSQQEASAEGFASVLSGVDDGTSPEEEDTVETNNLEGLSEWLVVARWLCMLCWKDLPPVAVFGLLFTRSV